jgi:hypothetical protein
MFYGGGEDMAARPERPVLSKEQRALLLKIWKYYDKHKDMIEEYKKAETKSLAVEKYSKIFPVRAGRYERAWKFMPSEYEDRMTSIDDRVANWIITWSKKMFGVIPTKTEVEGILAEIKEKLK